MQITLNTLRLDNEGTLVPVKVTVSVSAGIGIHVINMKDSGIKEMLLRTIAAIQDARYRIPGKKIVISFSEEITTLFSLSDAAVAIALLIATKQIKPVLKYDIVNISGELRLDGSLKKPSFICSQYSTCVDRIEKHKGLCTGCCFHQWPNEKTKYQLPDWQMYLVPDDIDKVLFNDTDVYSIAQENLTDIIQILETSTKDKNYEKK